MKYQYVTLTTDRSYLTKEKIYQIMEIDNVDNSIRIIDDDGDSTWLTGPEVEDKDSVECQYCDKDGDIISPSTDYAIF